MCKDFIRQNGCVKGKGETTKGAIEEDWVEASQGTLQKVMEGGHQVLEPKSAEERGPCLSGVPPLRSQVWRWPLFKCGHEFQSVAAGHPLPSIKLPVWDLLKVQFSWPPQITSFNTIITKGKQYLNSWRNYFQKSILINKNQSFFSKHFCVVFINISKTKVALRLISNINQHFFIVYWDLSWISLLQCVSQARLF